MSLKTLVFIAAFAYTLIIGGSLLGYRYFIVFPEIEKASIELHENDIKAIYALYNGQKNTLMNFNLDWSKWDESYEYLNNQNNEFVPRNINGSFLESGVDALAFIKNNGDLLYASIKQKNVFIEVDSLSDISDDMDKLSLIEKDRQFGFIRIDNKLGYFASSAVQNSEETLKPNGVLVFIKYFNKDFFDQISLITIAKFKLQHLSNIENMVFNEEPYLSESNIKLSKIKNIYHIWTTNHVGEPIGIMEITYPKSSIPKPLDLTTLFSILALLALPIFITGVVWLVFLTPITNMFKQLKEMSKEGTVKKINNRSYITEFELFTSTFNELADKITDYQDQLENESQIDGLTNIYNRRYFDTALDKAWRNCVRNNTPIAIIMMDIDFFKKYNDEYGHQQGDVALISVADTLNKLSRRAGDVVARYGGEEFIMIIHPDNLEQLTDTLDLILKSIRKLNIEHCKSEVAVNLTISCGACHIPEPGTWMIDDRLLAIKIADQGLYKAKNAGRDQFHISTLSSNSNPRS